jgi:hypothetical protein
MKGTTRLSILLQASLAYPLVSLPADVVRKPLVGRCAFYPPQGPHPQAFAALIDMSTLLRQLNLESSVTEASQGNAERQESQVDEMTWKTPVEPLGFCAQHQNRDSL